MKKTSYTLLFLLFASNVMAQDGARAMGNSLGKFIAGFLIVFLLFRFVIRPLLRKK